MNGIPCNDSKILIFQEWYQFQQNHKWGEMSAVTGEMTAPWNEITLPTFLTNYKLENVFNTDDFGLPMSTN